MADERLHLTFVNRGIGDGIGRAGTEFVAGVKRAFAPVDIEDHPLSCDRCSSHDDVRIHDGCIECGPVPLCRNCRAVHTEELIEGEHHIVRGYN